MKMKSMPAHKVHAGMYLGSIWGDEHYKVVSREFLKGRYEDLIRFIVKGANNNFPFIVNKNSNQLARRGGKKLPLISFSYNNSINEFYQNLEDKNLKVGDKFHLVIKPYNGRKQIKKVKLSVLKYESYCGDPNCCGMRPIVKFIHKGKEHEFSGYHAARI